METFVQPPSMANIKQWILSNQNVNEKISHLASPISDYRIIAGVTEKKYLTDSEMFTKVINTCLRRLNMDYSTFIGNINCRKEQFVLSRQLTMYFALKYTSLTTTAVGKRFNKDHATAIHSRRVIKDYIQTDKNIRAIVADITESLLPYKLIN